jgi:GDPmannose 4,6-dehydratase
MRALIFGANGQDGHFLNDLLVRGNVEVISVSRRGNHILGDVADFKFVNKLISDTKPEYIFHLAANSTTRHNVLFENYRTICDGTNNILESVLNVSPYSKVFLSGSAMQFENYGVPINENTPFAAKSPYAVARIQSTYAARYYRDVFGIKVYVGYLFNHDSPLRSDNHVNQKIAKAVQRIANGSEEKIVLGDLSVKKEFNYAGDIVKAIWQLIQQDSLYEAVLGSGMAFSILDWVKECFGIIGIDWSKYISHDESFKTEYKILVSDPKKILALGWKPQVELTEMARIMVNLSEKFR